MEKVTPKFGRRIVVYEPGIIHEWPSQGCERYSISPVLLKQESFGIFDDNLIIVEDYLSDSEILESEQFLELKRKEKEYFRSHYPKRQLGQSSEDFLKGLRNNPCREGYLSVLLTDEEICECFN